ncbi:MAG: hypothetical protein KHF84_06145 [Thermoplasmata archaeon]|nr:hypothetical protein [Candidatus Sysuiplasma jiujiangense]
MSNVMGSADHPLKMCDRGRKKETFISGHYGSCTVSSFAAGIFAGVAAGVADIFFPASLHNLAFYSAVYASIALFSACIAYLVNAKLWALRTLGIASLSMGVWSILWTAYYAVFRYAVWYRIFIISKTLGIGLGYSVSIETYIVSTVIQTLGGVIVILFSRPGLSRVLNGHLRKPSD